MKKNRKFLVNTSKFCRFQAHSDRIYGDKSNIKNLRKTGSNCVDFFCRVCDQHCLVYSNGRHLVEIYEHVI